MKLLLQYILRKTNMLEKFFLTFSLLENYIEQFIFFVKNMITLI